MEYITLIGIVILVVGFALKLDSILVIMVAAVATALAGGLNPMEFLETLGNSFVSNRSIPIFIIVMVVTGTLERNGLKQAAAALMQKVKSASAGMVVGLYGIFRLVFAAFNVSFGGVAGFVRPIVMPMAQAAELGTKKVMEDHSSLGVVVTTDGTVTDIPREDYREAEARAITDMQKTGKPFVVLVNTQSPGAAPAEALCAQLRSEYGVQALAMDCMHMQTQDIGRLLEAVMYAFPVEELRFFLPSWVRALPDGHPVKAALYDAMLERAGALGALLLRVQAERGGEDVGRAADVHRGEHVFKDRHGLEQADILERARDAALRDDVRGIGDDALVKIALRAFAGVDLFHFAVRVVADDGLAQKVHTAVGRLIDAGDAVEGRGLPGAVRADQRDDLAVIDVHGKVIDGDDAAELHGDMLNVKNGRTHASLPPFTDLLVNRLASPASEISRSPMMPRRKKSTTIMMTTENTTMRKPVRSSGTLNAPMVVSLSRKRSHHSEHAMNRNEPMQLPEIEPMPPMTTMSRIS